MSATRRALGGAAIFGAAFAATATVGLSPTVEAENPDAALLAACRAMHAAADRRDVLEARPGWPADEMNDALEQWEDAITTLRDTPATTLPGLRAKAQAVARVLRNELRVQLAYTVEEQAQPHELLALYLVEEAAQIAA